MEVEGLVTVITTVVIMKWIGNCDSVKVKSNFSGRFGAR